MSKISFSLALTLLLLELGLRFFPGIVPLDLLIYFETGPRTNIARARGLPTRWDVVLIERDDGGPEFGVFKPYTTIAWPIKDNGTVNTVVMDELGFCNSPDNSRPPQVDLITLGDSFTTCHAVEPQATWTNQLANLTGLSMYNLGKGGVGIHEYIQILKKFGLQKSPRIVILNVYEGNDFRDARNFYKYRLLAAAGEIQPTPTPSSEVLEQYSYTFNLVQAFDKYVEDNKPAAATASQSTYEPVNFRYRLVFPDQTIPWNLENTDTDEVEYAQRLYTLRIEAGVFESVEAALATFVQLSQQYGFVPIVTYTPSAHTAYAANVVFDDPALTSLMPWFSQIQRDYLRQLGTKLGYTFIDLTPALQAAVQVKGSQDLLYYRYDLHLTPSGHTVIAKALNQALADLGLVPGASE